MKFTNRDWRRLPYFLIFTTLALAALFFDMVVVTASSGKVQTKVLDFVLEEL